jgi:8-hydroxy-5-deazaflavin:NADPH oxidoreductase
MKIAVLGTGMVGRALAGRLAELGHDVVIGTRDPQRTLSRTEPDFKGIEPYAEWQQTHPDVRLVTFPEAGEYGELIVNATAGTVSLAALEATGAQNLAGKVVLDLALPLVYSDGAPPELGFAHTDSLGEQIQRAFPDAQVVKTLNTVGKDVMIDPARLPGEHNLFLSGDHAEAKDLVRRVLGDFGWPQERLIDLGGIQTARSVEMYMQLFFNLFAVFGDFDFNIAVMRAGPH